MKKPYVFGLLTIVAVALFLLNYGPKQVHAQQQPSGIRIQAIGNPGMDSKTTIPVSGKIVGFSCASPGETVTCFVATTD